MRYSLIMFILIFKLSIVNAQIFPFAVVTPNGTTFICPTLDSAYNKALNGDYIYLPGGTFTLSNPIEKNIHLIGAGYFEDSSMATGITVINNLVIKSGTDGVSIEGVYLNGNIQFGFSEVPDLIINNCSIKRCCINGNINFLSSSISNSPYSISISECIIGGITGYPTDFISVSNSIIFGTLTSVRESLIQNNIFLFQQDFYNGLAFNGSSANCIVKNNIFHLNHYMNGTNNSFYNNIGIWNNGVYTGTYATNAMGSGNIIEPWENTFDNSGSPGPFNYPISDFHLKANSIGKNAGTDETDIGIYGGIFPWTEGSVPSNPHIYFKKVGSKTDESGQLQIEFKVRTINN